MSIIAGLMAPLDPKSMKTRSTAENARTFLLVSQKVQEAAASNGSWDEAFEAAFGGPLGKSVAAIFAAMGTKTPEWTDPDADYEDDVRAWLDAVEPAMHDYLAGHDQIMNALAQ